MAKIVDMETCSWCTDEVPDASLREIPDGARLCRPCHADYRADPGQITRGSEDYAEYAFALAFP